MAIRGSTTTPHAGVKSATKRIVDAHAHPRDPNGTNASTSAKASANASAKASAEAGGDAFEARGLKPFADNYAASTIVPSLAKIGPTVATFDEAQVRALHRAYWSAPASASLTEMAAIAFRDPAFKGRKRDAVVEKQIGRVFEKLPASFPWGWRSRALAATSCALVDALLRAPQGTSVAAVVAELQKSEPAFPSAPGFIRAARETWPSDPARFPFAKRLRSDGDGGFKLEARGANSNPIRKDGLGRFVMTKELAEKVAELARSPQIEYGWTREDFARFVDDELGGGGAFTAKSLGTLRTQYPAVVPDFLEVRAQQREKVARAIHALYFDEGITGADDIIRTLHERIGTPLWKQSMLTWFREHHPDLVPEFKSTRAANAWSDARTLLDAIKAHPNDARLDVARSLGHDDKRAAQLIKLIRKRWPDELERLQAHNDYTKDDVAALQQAIADAPLNALMRDVLDILEREHPDFVERHPISSGDALYNVVVTHGGLRMSTWRNECRLRYGEVFADTVRKSAPGTTLLEIVQTIQDEHEGAYSIGNVTKMLADARAPHPPAELAPLTKLLDKDGAYPWEKSRVTLDHALAVRVAKAFAAHPGEKMIDIVRALKRDPAFARDYPTFSTSHISNLRARFPKIVPYVDDGPQSATRRQRIDAQRRELTKIANKLANAADDVDDNRGLTVSALARAIGVPPHRALAAIRQCPALFPWYRERPTGTVDLYLATRVGHAIESAPLGTTLEQIVDELRADPAFRERYPQFNYFSTTKLRDRYPELVPNIHTKNQIERSKILVDAIRSAKKGTPFSDIVADVRARHAGSFPDRWQSEDYVKQLWADAPELFPFAQTIASRAGGFSLVGRGEKIARRNTTKDDDDDDATLATRLAKLEQIHETLPVLDKLVDGIKGKPFADTEILAIQHLLGPQVAMFNAAHKLGMTPSRTSIIGIPYSASDAVVDTLTDKGFDVRVPPLDLDAWYAMVKDAMEERIASALKNGRKIVVFDDGGLVAMMFDKYPHLAAHAHLFRIVEQTTRGITVADGVDLHAPVVNVAQSWAKFVEGPMVGSTVQQKLLKRLAGIDVKSIKGKHVGVNGFGTIGAPLAEFLRAQGAIVTVMDVGEDARERAKPAGFDVVDGNDEKARAKYFGKQDIVVGSTGHQSVTAADIEAMKDGAILGSSSSKLVEIDVDTLKALSKRGRVEVVDADSFPPTVRYHLKDGRHIDLLASGFPMNFDGSVEDVAAERIQLTMGLMLAGALQAAGVSAAGFHRLDPSIQLEMLRAFHDDVKDDLSDAQGKAVEGALTVAELHLKNMEKKHGALDDDLRHANRR